MKMTYYVIVKQPPQAVRRDKRILMLTHEVDFDNKNMSQEFGEWLGQQNIENGSRILMAPASVFDTFDITSMAEPVRRQR